MAGITIDEAAGMQSQEDAQRQTVTSGDAVNSPEMGGPYTTALLSADPELKELLQDINENITEQSILISEQSNQVVNGNIVNGMFLGFICGALLFLGLWLGGRK